MKPDNFDVFELIQSLQGTCMTIDNFLPEGMTEDDLTEADHTDIDNEIFKCETCDWWCEVCERVEDEEYCEDCRSDNE